MKVKILSENGYAEMLFGLGFSYNKTTYMTFKEFCLNKKLVAEMETVAGNLAPKSGGHNSFLELLNVHMEITAPRNFWAQMDRYRVGKSQLSESTMHTIQRRKLTENDFESIDQDILIRFNNLLKYVTDGFTKTAKLKGKELQYIKNNLPEGFLQKRIVMLNYKSLANIIIQRRNHTLGYWKQFLESVMEQIESPELLPSIEKGVK